MLDDERKEYQENLYRGVIELKEIRNTFVAAIGSAIGIFLTLISIGSIPKENTWYIIIGIVGAISIFIGYNVYIATRYQKYDSLRPKYVQIIGDISSLEGLISTASLDDSMTGDNMKLLTAFTFLIGSVLMYELQYYAYNMTIQTTKPIQDDFRESYTLAKGNLDAFKKAPIFNKYIVRIELFIQMFEKSESKKKNKKSKMTQA